MPGVSESAIRIGVVLPAGASREAPLSVAVVEVLSTYVDAVNRSGGVFRRRVELVPLAQAAGVDQEIFAAIGGFTPDGDDWSDRMEAARVPFVRVYPPPTEAGDRSSRARSP